ncbi:hypothetical protein G3I15_07125, partial [Streptomyces sp. SID10244]|nr:hypothetical protein [Streptomyces sp. SID10244]
MFTRIEELLFGADDLGLERLAIGNGAGDGTQSVSFGLQARQLGSCRDRMRQFGGRLLSPLRRLPE